MLYSNSGVFQSNLLGIPDPRTVYVMYVPQSAVNLIAVTVAMYRNGLRGMTDRLSYSQETLLLRCLTGAVSCETTSTYTYVLPPIGTLHYLTGDVNHHIASSIRCCRTYAVRTFIAKRLVKFDIRTTMSAAVLTVQSSWRRCIPLRAWMFDIHSVHGSFISTGSSRCTSNLSEIRHTGKNGVFGANCVPYPDDWLVVLPVWRPLSIRVIEPNDFCIPK